MRTPSPIPSLSTVRKKLIRQIERIDVTTKESGPKFIIRPKARYD